MVQPTWITPAGSLGTIPEGTFYQVLVEAQTGTDDVVYFRVIAGELPEGIQLTSNGTVSGVPRAVAKIQGLPREVAEDVTSRFAVRAYTLDGSGTIARLADRTFTITVTGQDVPEFVTPSGLLASYYDGSEADVQIIFTDPDPGDDIAVSIIAGNLPPGLEIDNSGRITGIISPLVGPPGTAQSGYDASAYAQFPYDFTTRSASVNYQFTVEISDGKDRNIRTFEIFVYSKDSMTADNEEQQADNTFITADIMPTRTPILLTAASDLGRVRADNYFAFQFRGLDFDGDAIEYVLTVGAGVGYDEGGFDADGSRFDSGSFSLPPGLSLDITTGWLYGYIPDQGATESTYRFGVRVRKTQPTGANWTPALEWQFGDIVSFSGRLYTALQTVPIGIDIDNREYWQFIPEIISDYYYFTLTITGNIETDVTWLTGSDLGTVPNGSISTLEVAAENTGGRLLMYRLDQAVFNRLPQGLTLQPTGHITGRVSFNTFALDGGVTTFDVVSSQRLGLSPITFDLEFRFTVNAYAPSTEELGFGVASFSINNGGSGYTDLETFSVTISAPPATAESIQATAGVATITGGVITAIAVGNPGRGYLTPPTVTVTGGGGSGAAVTARLFEVEQENAVSVFRTFSVRVDRQFDEPYETLQIFAMPPLEDRALLDDFLNDLSLIPVASVYRNDDPNFGVADSIVYDHAYGLASADLDTYVTAMQLNHYDRRLTLGPIKTARALAPDGSVLYEVIYSEIVDDLVNQQGQSVSSSVEWPVSIDVDGVPVTSVYPNSLANMRDRIIDNVGRVSQALPLWMTSNQANGRVLGFTRAWVIAYIEPGQSGRIAYNINQGLTWQLNTIDFEVDRYVLDQSQTHNWDPDLDQWVPQPAAATTFDQVSDRLHALVPLDTFGVIRRTDTFATDGSIQQFLVSITDGAPRLLIQINGNIIDYANTYATSFVGDGTTTQYAWSEWSVLASSTQVSIAGIAQIAGVDYTVTDGVFTFAVAPPDSSVISMVQTQGGYRVSYGYKTATITILVDLPNTLTTYMADGSTADYPYTIIAGRTVIVKVDGVIQQESQDYVLASGFVVFDTAPDSPAIPAVPGSPADPEYNNGAIIDVVGNGSDFFKREVTTNGVRIMGAGAVGGQAAVPDAWLEKVARMFELFTDPTGAGINQTIQRQFIKDLSGDAGDSYHAGFPTLQRVARGAGSDYTPNFLTDEGIESWNLSPLFDTHVANDMVWYLNSTGDGYGIGEIDAQEVIEHVFHTLHMHGLPAFDLKMYPEFSADWQSGDLFAAIEEAYDAGVFDPSGYVDATWKTDPELFPVIAKEYLYLLNFCMFEYSGLWDGDSLAPEWSDSMRTQSGILANNPLGYALFNTYIAPVISKPSLATINSIFGDGNTPAQDDPSQAGASGYIVDTAPDSGSDVVIDQQSTVTVYQITDTYVNDPNSAVSQRTTFDLDGTRLINISDRWTSSDQFDKYLMFPKRTILG